MYNPPPLKQIDRNIGASYLEYAYIYTVIEWIPFHKMKWKIKHFILAIVLSAN